MHFTGTTYRPPDEAFLDAKLLQVTVGCAHNKCKFCNMYRDVKFQVEPLLQIEEDVRELRQSFSKIERIFLVNGDPLCLPAKKLQEITDIIIKHIPEIKVISAYASISNLKNKTDEDLAKIKEMRINDLWIGAETGNEEFLKYINKGHNLEEAYTELARLSSFGIRHNHCYILGIGGKGNGMQNAHDTAKFINKTKPSLVWCGTLGVPEEGEIMEDIRNGNFTLASELEILEEEMKLIELLELENVKFNGMHPTNLVSVHGILPQYKKFMIAEIEDFIDYKGKDFLSTSFPRNAE